MATDIESGSREVGQLAPFLLRPGYGNRVVVEVRAQQGAAPSQRTLDRIVAELASASRKRVVVDGPDLAGGARQDWDAGSLAELADTSAEHRQGDGQVVLRLLFLHGSFEGDPSVLGVSVRRDVAAVFQDQVDASGGLFVDPAVIGEATTIHELGHLLGLVDLVLDTGRADANHPGHSSNQRSVMYWAVESSDIGQLLGSQIPTEFDDADRADLAAIRSG